MSAVFTECGVPGCPRNTAGYCPKCEGQEYVYNPDRYQQGFQEGLEAAAKELDGLMAAGKMLGAVTGDHESEKSMLLVLGHATRAIRNMEGKG